jgi:hypothetical protein
MLVEDPRDTIKALCQLSNVHVNWHSYKKKYEQIKGLAKPISSQHTDTHFYSLSIYGLIKASESAAIGEYELTAVGKALCKSLDDGRIDEYRKVLSNLLINSKKGSLFKKFIVFVKARKRTSDSDVFRFVESILGGKRKRTTIEIVGRTLISWCEECGLIGRDRKNRVVWYIAQEPKRELTISQFFQILLEKYEQLRQSEIFGVERIYVDIIELRTIVCAELSWPIELFDSYLVKLLDSQLGEKIKLTGAPTSYFAGQQNFSYLGRLYAYIRIRCD